MSAGLSMEALAAKVCAHRGETGFDRRHVMKWEAGNAPLPEDLLHSVGAVLSVDSWAMTYLPESVLPARARLVYLNSDARLDRFELQHARALLMSTVRISVEKRFAALRVRHFYAPIVFKPGVEVTPDWADKVAARIRRRWGLGSAPVSDIAQTLEERHVTVSTHRECRQTARRCLGVLRQLAGGLLVGTEADECV